MSNIKDSGDRTEFSSGAVRDMHEGKGRFDLMPLEVICELLKRRSTNHSATIIEYIDCFMSSHRTSYLYNALGIFARERYTLNENHAFPEMFLDVAKHYEEGCKKYGEDNWRKGIPVNCYIDSAIRHLMKFSAGWTDEPHDRAFVWNLMCCIWEVDYGNIYRAQSGKESYEGNHQ